MGPMDPEELSCSRVETDKDSVVKSLDFPKGKVRNSSGDGHLTGFPCAESADSLAMTLVNDILDESIEIFNKVDEANLQNNNAKDVENSKEFRKVSTPCNSQVKTDHLVSDSDSVSTSSILDRTSCNNFDNSACPNLIEEGDRTDDKSREMSKTSCRNELIDSVDKRRQSTSSEGDSESPIMSDSESSVSQSNEKLPTHFANPFISEDNTDSNHLLNIDADSKSYSEVPLTCGSAQTPSRIPVENDITTSCSDYLFDQSKDQLVIANEFLPPGESRLDSFGEFNHPAVLEITESSQHDCFSHPDVLELRREHEEMGREFNENKEKAKRLDDCLHDLEKLLDKVGFLEKKICQQEMEIDLAKQERDIESKTLASLKQETTVKIDSLKKKYDQANKEKESMVMSYAKSEKELLDMKKEKTTLLKQIKDQQKENENVLSKLRVLSEDKSRLAVALDNKNMELSIAHKEIDKLKEDINSRDIKIKWIQNKLLGEIDLHKECPDKVEKLNGQIVELEKKLEKNKEDIEQYQKTIQELEAIKVLEGQVREEQAKLILERHDQSERVIKMKALQLKTDALIEENNNLSFQVQNLEVERLDLEKKLSESRQDSQELSNNLADLRSKLVQFDSISNQLTQERERLAKASEEVERLRKANEELMQDMSSCRSREAEMLSFTQKLTTKNVQLQSEFSNIESRAGELMLEAEKAESVSDTLKREMKMLKEELETERCKREEERNLLAREVAEGRSKVSQLESQLAETKSNLHASTNKHQALIRELQRELQVCHRKLEHEGRSVQNHSAQPNDSRSNSGSSPNQSFTGRSSPGASSSLASSLNSIPDATIVQPSHHQLEVSPGILVERILRLQTESKNYQDKIEFLEDHNTSLVEELKKKRKLLQSYILREQAGALASQASDIHKKEVSKHGGIMASVYGSRPTDEGMTLELSLEISHKLQVILEDTLLKNITLKENIDTLGDEIERLKKLHPS